MGKIAAKNTGFASQHPEKSLGFPESATGLPRNRGLKADAAIGLSFQSSPPKACRCAAFPSIIQAICIWLGKNSFPPTTLSGCVT